MIFQFHYGSIISIAADDATPSVTGFQFHYGSIISLLVVKHHQSKPYFNSTMVQLLGNKIRD